jgi:maleylacetate reductase
MFASVSPCALAVRRDAAGGRRAMAADRKGPAMTYSFVYEALPARVLFKQLDPSLLRDEVGRLGMARALVLATPPQEHQARELAAMLGDRAAAVFAGAVMHTPVEVTDAAIAFLREVGADGVVAIGGGSTTGLGKAIALRTGLPQLVVPTTYAGSEMTPILGETRDGVKTTQTTRKVLPQTVIYDVDLTLSLPARLSSTSASTPSPTPPRRSMPGTTIRSCR